MHMIYKQSTYNKYLNITIHTKKKPFFRPMGDTLTFSPTLGSIPGSSPMDFSIIQKCVLKTV